MKVRYKLTLPEPEEPPCLYCRHLEFCIDKEQCRMFGVYIETGRALLPSGMRRQEQPG
jgi:hypothetical protein